MYILLLRRRRFILLFFLSGQRDWRQLMGEIIIDNYIDSKFENQIDRTV